MADSVQVTGVESYVTALRGVAADTGDLDAFDEVAQRAASAIERDAPKKSRRLAGSVRGRRSRNAAVVVATASYAGPINYGWPTRGITATGFMQAADSGSEQTAAAQRLEDDIDSQIARRGLSR